MMKKYGEPTLMVPVVEESVLPSSFLNVNMIAQENDQLPAQNESSIAINPLNPANMIGSAVDYRGNSSTWAYYSNDSGRTWKNITLGATTTRARATCATAASTVRAMHSLVRMVYSSAQPQMVVLRGRCDTRL
jgi:hypothetical protein